MQDVVQVDQVIQAVIDLLFELWFWSETVFCKGFYVLDILYNL
jgi:hypothetical protein